MRINDVVQKVDLSKRAVKYYEEQGLLQIKKDENGYRNYTENDVKILKEISVYRKLGISIADIRLLLEKKDTQILEKILREKESELSDRKEELEALRSFIRSKDVERAYQEIDYSSVADAITDAVPGFYGYYFMNHFLPYLQIRIETPQQEEAYHNIIRFWDTTTIRIPFMMRLSSWLMYRLVPRPALKKNIKNMDRMIATYLNPTEAEYEKLKKQVQDGVKMKNNPLYKYSPVGFTQRKFMKELQNKGYNDIFIPNMIALSPKYREYHDALTSLNNRICQELGLYYDTDFHLVQR